MVLSTSHGTVYYSWFCLQVMLQMEHEARLLLHPSPPLPAPTDMQFSMPIITKHASIPSMWPGSHVIICLICKTQLAADCPCEML